MALEVSQNNKRIAKNAVMLYFRMFIMVGVALYTSRVILKALGVIDFGIYNVVAGVVALMGVVNVALTISTQRFITYELGRGDRRKLTETFSACFFSFIVLSFVVLFLAETVGLWFLNTQLVIPQNRLLAANWCYQFSLLSCVNSLLTNPYNACIIAHEKMDVYAYVSIIEVLLKLAIVFLLFLIPLDRLIIYGALLMISQFIVTMIYVFYCKKKFVECQLILHKDFNLYKHILSFTSWNLIGSIANVLQTQGLNVLINIFFNPTANASRGIAVQVNSNVGNFFSNFFNAIRPQIIKYYSVGDMQNLYKLLFRSSRFAFYLILLLSLPIILETQYILKLWLGFVPEYAVVFTRLMIAITAVDAISNPLMTLAQANGNIKKYCIVTGSLLLTILPISYIALKAECGPESVFVVALGVSIVCLFSRLIILREMLKFPIAEYMRRVLLVIINVTILSSFIPLFLYINMDVNLYSFLLVCVVSILTTCVTSLYVGMIKSERVKIASMVLTHFIHKKYEG
jgi:O-antigen/teichoic acid export membrane protein